MIQKAIVIAYKGSKIIFATEPKKEYHNRLGTAYMYAEIGVEPLLSSLTFILSAIIPKVILT